MNAVNVVSLKLSPRAVASALILSATLMVAIGGLPAHAQITPSADAYTTTATPGNNFGAKPLLDVQSATQNTYIQFDLSSLPAGMPGSSIAKATLKLYVNTVPTAGSFNVNLINGTWDEKTITANLAPALGTTIAASIPLSASNVKDYIIIDVTLAVQAWLNRTQANDGIALVANSPLNATFDSKESTTQSHPPELDIVFAGGTGTITGITTATGSGLTGGGTSGTLNLGLLNTCSNNQVLKWSGSAWGCANLSGSGTVTSVGLSAPSSDFTVTGSPVTSSGTLGLNWAVAPTSANTANAIVKRDATGSFNASAVNLSGSLFVGTDGIAVDGVSANSNGIWGVSQSTSGPLYGVFGGTYSLSSNAAGVYGAALNGGSGAGLTFGVEGISYSPVGVGVFGYTRLLSNTGSTVSSPHAGVWGDSITGAGVYATADNNNAVVAVNNAFVPTLWVENNASNSWVLWATGNVGSCRSDSLGDLACTGTVTGGVHANKIDHPLDPANKYLVHSGVESPDRKTVYDGVVALDANGEASVQLPAYVESLNGQFRYQLTAIGAPGPNLYIAEEISRNQFRIAGGKPGMKVSWQVTGIRQDAWSKANPPVVEEEKSSDERGYYLHPEALGQPREKGLVTLPPVKQRPGIPAQAASTSNQAR